MNNSKRKYLFEILYENHMSENSEKLIVISFLSRYNQTKIVQTGTDVMMFGPMEVMIWLILKVRCLCIFN